MAEIIKAPILECKQLMKRYGSHLALNSLDLTIPRGKIVGLLGSNGSGKTTMIKLASGILTPTSGEILVSGQNPGLETKDLVSYLSDKSYLPDWMRVCDIIDFFKDFYKNFNSPKAYEMLKRLGINSNDRLK